MIDVVVSRGTVVPFETLPPRSIALDGYVQGPQIDAANERYSFDHHDGCIRLVTRATCAQVFDALLLGLDPYGFTVFTNDVDADTVLAVWLLDHPKFVRLAIVREYVEAVASVDALGPAYPTAQPERADAFYEGVMAPEAELRRTRKYGEADLVLLLKECCLRFTALLSSTLEWTPRADGNRPFEITHSGSGWVMVESDHYIFDILYRVGITRAIVYQRLPDGSIAYTIGKKSEFISGFPVGPHSKPGTILNALAKREPGWGGGSTVGGAPRNPDGSRSHLTPDEVLRVVEGVLAPPTA